MGPPVGGGGPAEFEPQGPPIEGAGSAVEDALVQEAIAQLSPEAQAEGSTARLEAKDRQASRRMNTLEESIRGLSQGRYATASNIIDADIIRKADATNYPPKPEFTELRSKPPEELKDSERQQIAEDNARMIAVLARQNDPEYYMRRERKKAPGDEIPKKQTFVKTNDGNMLFLREDAPGTSGDTPKGRDDARTVRSDIRGEYGQIISYIDTIATVGQNVMDHGVGSIGGIVSFDSDGNWTGFPVADREFLTAMGFNKGISNAVGAKVMKMLDENGRLTDMDIKVGRLVGLSMLQGFSARVEDSLNATLQATGLTQTNAYREAAAKVMQMTTIAIIDEIFTKGTHSGNVLLSPSASVQLQQKRAAAEKWLLSRKVSPPKPKRPEGGRIISGPRMVR